MPFDKPTRNALARMVGQARGLLKADITAQLQTYFRLQPDGTVLRHDGLTEDQAAAADDVRQLLEHYVTLQTGPEKGRRTAAFDRLVREIGFTILNRLAALRLCEERGLVTECVRKGTASDGFRLFDQLTSGALGPRDQAYRFFIENLYDELALDLGTLFDRHSPLSYVFPSERTLEQVLGLMNDPGLEAIWREDETIGWIYQYYNDEAERKRMRDESQAPRNSYELAVRNQFFTPRYVVEFLTDNTLGRIWYEMTQGDTQLAESCRYLVRRKHPVFLNPGETAPEPFDAKNERPYPDATSEMWTRPNPELTDVWDIFRYALTVNGYDYPKEHWDKECADLVSPRMDKYRETGKWEGTFEELRCCLFFEQRRSHFVDGYPGTESDVKAIQDLYGALCERWDIETEFIPYRPKKDPREILMLDPAGGSGHFGLYCFDLFETIYAEAYDDPELAPRLQKDFPDRAEYHRQVARLILENNLHIIDIDPRACQIAALALWLRAQRSWQGQGLRAEQRPQVRKVNVVCAEPMPGERDLLEEFVAELHPRVLGDLVRVVFEKMKLAGEAGSLLKIEEELREAIATAKSQWLRGETAEQLALFGEQERRPKAEQLTLFDLSGITEERFWDEAEGRVLDALKVYAQLAGNGKATRRRLFADDAEQGFAFIDSCRKRYDVVLMNPPYGDHSLVSRAFLQEQYDSSSQDVYSCFYQRGVALLVTRGELGALTSRSFLLFSSFFKLRHFLLANCRILTLADFGHGVLDDAMVETCAIVTRSGDGGDRSLFYRLLRQEQKGESLQSCVLGMRDNLVHSANQSDFSAIPGSPFSYWAGSALRDTFTRLPRMSEMGAMPTLGLVSADNERFVRLRWEVLREKSDNWPDYCKGGDYSKYYDDPHLVVNWEDDGKHIERSMGGAVRLRDIGNYFQPGINYPLVTNLGMNGRVMPANCIFDNTAPTILFKELDRLWLFLGFVNTRVFEYFVRLLTMSRHWQVGYLRTVPYPSMTNDVVEEVVKLVRQCYDTRRQWDQHEETSHLFCGPLVSVAEPALLEPLARCLSDWEDRAVQIHANTARIDYLIAYSFRLDADFMDQLNDELDYNSISYFSKNTEPTNQEVLPDVFSMLTLTPSVRASAARIQSARKSLALRLRYNYVGPVVDMLSHTVGISFGRWDIRLGIDPTLAPKLSDPFAPLPVCPPGMLVGPDGLPATSENIVSEEWLRARPNAITLPPEGSVKRPTISDSEYPIHIAWNGMLVDDPGLDPGIEQPHGDDIVRRMREVLGVLWGERADAIEGEACEILGVPSLRDYFRRPSGFFADHLKRYSKSRRQAPIYWPLSTASGRYTTWLYYHRLTGDTLFAVVNQYVNPKIEQVQRRIDSLEERLKDAKGKAATEARDRLDDMKGFLSELNDFRAELLRVAALPYKPDLNDGVIINAAPLHKLFGLRKWANDAKEVWDKLVRGEYDWAHMAYTIWPERVKKVCEGDLSIAIAHNLEHLYKGERRVNLGRRTKAEDQEEQGELIEAEAAPARKAGKSKKGKPRGARKKSTR